MYSGRAGWISSHISKMILITILSILALAAIPCQSYSVTTVHGSIYDWSTLETLNNVIVEVDSSPPQTLVSKTGTYSFTLPPGYYTIKARSGATSSKMLYTEDNISITGDGDYVIDLILFPVTDLDDLDFLNENITAIVPVEPEPPKPNLLMYGIIGVILTIIVVSIGFVLFKKFWKKPETEPVIKAGSKPDSYQEIKLEPVKENKAGEKQETVFQLDEEPDIEIPAAEKKPITPAPLDPALPDDLKEIIRIMEKNGGRMTQLELRKTLPYSEAKVSLMITDLESRGLVKKVKKGRGNVIILTRIE
jgi:uncharacterized membrane protein